MITVYRRGEVYWVRSCEPGSEVRKSLRTRDKQIAQQLARQMEIDILSGGRLREVLWPEFQEEFLQWIGTQVRPSTIRGYRITAKRFGRFLENRRATQVKQISPATIAAFLEERKSDKHPSTKRNPGSGGIRFDLRSLRRIFNYAIACGYMTKNPVLQNNLNSPAGQTLPFTAKEISEMLEYKDQFTGPQLRAILLTFIHTGLRISDVMTLTKQSVAGGFLIRETIKRGRVVSLPIHSQLRSALDEHLAAQSAVQKNSPYLFVTEEGKLIRSLPRDLRRFWKRAKISGAHPHRFRNTFAVRLLADGASLYDVAKLMGISMQTAERYYAPYVRELQERGARLIENLAAV